MTLRAYAQPRTITVSLELIPTTKSSLATRTSGISWIGLLTGTLLSPAQFLSDAYQMSTGREITITPEDDELMVEQDVRGAGTELDVQAPDDRTSTGSGR